MEEGITALTRFAVVARKRGSQKVSIVLAHITQKTATAMAHRMNSSGVGKDWFYWVTDDWDKEAWSKIQAETIKTGKLATGTLKLGKVSNGIAGY